MVYGEHMNIHIREISKDDCHAIWEIENACFSDPWSEDAFVKELSNPICSILAAFDGEIMAGFINVWFVAGELTINNIAVREEYRRRGIAEALINTAIERYPNTEQVLLEVRESNHAAQELYKKLDFTHTGTRKNYYTNPQEDALLMTKTIGGKNERIHI